MMTLLVVLAGAGQVLLAMVSLVIPHVLQWKQQTALLQPLTKQVFWTYAAYIWSINMSMGLLAMLRPQWLLDGSPLAQAVAGFTALYWGVRAVLQFACFETDNAPVTPMIRLGKHAMDVAFVSLTVVYAAVTIGVR